MDHSTPEKARLEEQDLLKVFNTVVRPTLEYAVPTYHSMLTGEMRDEIEQIQKRASKLIFGWDSDSPLFYMRRTLNNMELNN